MASVRKLSKPPIAEAIVDIRVAGGKLEAAGLEPLAQLVRADYSDLKPIKAGEASFQTREGKFYAEARDLGLEGYLLRSESASRVVQLRPDRLTFNRLPPYSSADEVIAEALRLWEMYRKAVQPEIVVRVAMRYINRLDLPYEDREDFGRFLTAPPPVPAELSQSMSEFLTRVVLHYPEVGQAVAIITQKLGVAGGSGKPTPLVLDIDVFREGQLDGSSPKLAALFEHLRSIKNQCFFSLLTEETVSLFT